MKVKEWFKKNWQGTIYGGILVYLLTKFIDFIINGIGSILQAESITEKWNVFINSKVTLPLWLTLVFIALLLVIFLIKICNFFRKSKKLFNANFLKKVGDDVTIEFQSPETFKPIKADQSFNISLNSNFLGSQSGIFSIWAHVSDVHNENSKGYMYIISYATKKGAFQKTPGYATYPNAWAINRIRPHENCSKGIWRFWCNNAGTEQIRIDSSEILTSGWHLFTVAWSERSNYIKFIIDKSEIGQRDFEHWPSDFSENVRIGTWPNMAPGHFFDSRIGPWRFVKSEFDMSIIEDYFKNKPE